MGIDLTKALFARNAATLTAGELVVMGYMCLTALDKEGTKGQPPGLYFGGWEPLALALGYDDFTPAAKEKVRRAIKGLREKGLIKPLVAHAQTGERQVYRMQVGITGAPIPSPNRATGSEPQEGHNFRGDRGSDSEPPRTEKGNTKDLREDISIASETQLQTAPSQKSDEAIAHKFEGNPSNACTECGCAYQNRAAHPLYLLRGGA